MNRLADLAHDPVMAPHLPALAQSVAHRESDLSTDRKAIELARILSKLPTVTPSSTDVSHDCIRIGIASDLDAHQANALQETLVHLKPWRKGPFDIFGVRLDSEWDSSIKWNRLAAHLPCQTGKRVLDIGASNGYYLFRLADQHPAWALGIEPYLTFYSQFMALSRYLAIPHVHCLPLKLEALPEMRGCFDTVLCMGILYHRRSPLDTLLQIHRYMAPGGLLVVETLIVEGDTDMALFPQKRYARMNNVFFIPTASCLAHWLNRCGFTDIRCIDISRTTLAEQHKTTWIDTQSLEDFLDPRDSMKTIEGYPAPVRAMVLATAGHR